MNKPREWWFNVTWRGEYSRPISKEPFKVMDDDEIVPVIEKSAYDALAAEKDDVFDKLKHCADMGAKLADEVIELRAANAELVEALRVTLKHKDLEVPGNAFGDKARQALAKHGGGK